MASVHKKDSCVFWFDSFVKAPSQPTAANAKTFWKALVILAQKHFGPAWLAIHTYIYIYIYIFGLFRVFRPEGDGTGHTRPAGGRVAGQPPPLPPLRGQAPDRPAGAELLAVVPGVAQPGAPAGSLGPAGRGRGPLPQLGVDRRGPSHSSGELGYI